MNKAICAGWSLTLIFALPFVTGCGDSEGDLAKVQGRIMLNGEPLKNARVEFDPVNGSPSYGETDGSGYYELEFGPGKPGAIVGQHKVRIYTRRMYSDEQGNEVVEPEILPPQYNHHSVLGKQVEPGSNTINFELKVPSLRSGDSEK